MTDNNGQQARREQARRGVEEMDALIDEFSDLEGSLMDRVRPEVLERLEIGLGEGQWPEDIQQPPPPPQPEPQQHDFAGGQNPNYQKLIAGMHSATLDGLPGTIRRFSHMANNECYVSFLGERVRGTLFQTSSTFRTSRLWKLCSSMMPTSEVSIERTGTGYTRTRNRGHKRKRSL